MDAQLRSPFESSNTEEIKMPIKSLFIGKLLMAVFYLTIIGVIFVGIFTASFSDLGSRWFIVIDKYDNCDNMDSWWTGKYTSLLFGVLGGIFVSYLCGKASQAYLFLSLLDKGLPIKIIDFMNGGSRISTIINGKTILKKSSRPYLLSTTVIFVLVADIAGQLLQSSYSSGVITSSFIIDQSLTSKLNTSFPHIGNAESSDPLSQQWSSMIKKDSIYNSLKTKIFGNSIDIPILDTTQYRVIGKSEGTTVTIKVECFPTESKVSNFTLDITNSTRGIAPPSYTGMSINYGDTTGVVNKGFMAYINTARRAYYDDQEEKGLVDSKIRMERSASWVSRCEIYVTHNGRAFTEIVTGFRNIDYERVVRGAIMENLIPWGIGRDYGPGCSTATDNSCPGYKSSTMEVTNWVTKNIGLFMIRTLSIEMARAGENIEFSSCGSGILFPVLIIFCLVFFVGFILILLDIIMMILKFNIINGGWEMTITRLLTLLYDSMNNPNLPSVTINQSNAPQEKITKIAVSTIVTLEYTNSHIGLIDKNEHIADFE